MGSDTRRPLKDMADAFAGMADDLRSSSDLPVTVFVNACDRVSPLFSHLGMAFKFAEKDYVAKVKDLGQAGNEFGTLPPMIEADIRADKVRLGGSHTRNLLRVKRGVELIRILFQHTLSDSGDSLKNSASTAYREVLQPHHSWPLRKAVAVGMHVLPTKSNFLASLNEKEDSAREYMQSFINASESVVLYVNGLFTSKQLGLDW